MVDVEKMLLAKLTTEDGLAHVLDVGMAPEVFEDPVNRVIFAWTLDYWEEGKKAPTAAVFEAEFPSVAIPTAATVEETTEWLVSHLQQRYATNQVQDLLRESGKSSVDDPIGTVAMMSEAAKRLQEKLGRHAGEARVIYTDVSAMLDDTLPEAPRPEILKRADGVPLFYRGEVNILFGDPEHGKTWVGLAACTEVLGGGGSVLVADLDHNGAAAIVARLLMLGAPKEALCDAERFRHCEPGEIADVTQVVDDCGAWRPDVVLVDSTGELLPMFSASNDSGDDFTRVHARVLQPLADTGAAVLLVDHLAKGKDSRMLGPGGTMAKRRTVGGLSLRVVREQPFTRAGGGSARLLVNKDRHGGVRDHCAAPHPGKDNDEQLAGTFVLDCTDGGTAWRVTPPQMDSGASGQEFRPTGLMERASKKIEGYPGEYTRNRAAEQTGGKKETTLLAIDMLEREGFVTKSQDRYPVYTSTKAYRQKEDPRSECFMPLKDVLRRRQDSGHHDKGDQGDE